MSLKELVGNPNLPLLQQLSISDNQAISCLLFAGPPGTGKTSAAFAFANTRFCSLYKISTYQNCPKAILNRPMNSKFPSPEKLNSYLDNHQPNQSLFNNFYLEINASNETTLTKIKEKVEIFLQNIPTNKKSRAILHLDEVDSMTESAQAFILAEFVKNPDLNRKILLIITANSVGGIFRALVDNSLVLEFERLEEVHMWQLLEKMDQEYHDNHEVVVDVNKNIKNALIQCSNGDARKLISNYQMINHLKMTSNYDVDDVYKLLGIPNSKLLAELLENLYHLKLKKSLRIFKEIKNELGMSEFDFLMYLRKFIEKISKNKNQGCLSSYHQNVLFTRVFEAEMKLSASPNSKLVIESLFGAIVVGFRLCEKKMGEEFPEHFLSSSYNLFYLDNEIEHDRSTYERNDYVDEPFNSQNLPEFDYFCKKEINKLLS